MGTVYWNGLDVTGLAYLTAAIVGAVFLVVAFESVKCGKGR